MGHPIGLVPQLAIVSCFCLVTAAIFISWLRRRGLGGGRLATSTGLLTATPSSTRCQCCHRRLTGFTSVP
jgi:hypothetical protein